MAKCCDFSSGKLRTSVSFETEARTDDGAGGSTTTWTAITGAPSRAAVRNVSGAERWASERIEAINKVKIVTRYTSLLWEGDRVQVDGRIYNVEHIANVEFANKWTEVTAVGGVAVGTSATVGAAGASEMFWFLPTFQ